MAEAPWPSFSSRKPLLSSLRVQFAAVSYLVYVCMCVGVGAFMCMCKSGCVCDAELLRLGVGEQVYVGKAVVATSG